ncbi:MAG: ATP-binding protein [Oligoflexia bacterium]|nr:ATP-binding protein [Oligoflexia bacterium]
MKPYKIKPNLHFIGRNTELAKLAKIGKQKEASIIVIYGRRRIGKTELIEQYFKKKKVLKFEGIQPDHLRPRSKNEERLFQLQQCLHLLNTSSLCTVVSGILSTFSFT